MAEWLGASLQSWTHEFEPRRGFVTNLVEHAKHELELSGQVAEDPAYAQSIIAAIAAFSSYGHSGGSASVAIEQIHRLLQFRTLSPLTSDPDEWIDQCRISNSPLWQNKRDPAAMSRDGGQTWYFVDGREAEEQAPDTRDKNYRMQELALGACMVEGIPLSEVTTDFYNNASIVGNVLLHAGQKLGMIPRE